MIYDTKADSGAEAQNGSDSVEMIVVIEQKPCGNDVY